jgi:hypothetical protein
LQDDQKPLSATVQENTSSLDSEFFTTIRYPANKTEKPSMNEPNFDPIYQQKPVGKPLPRLISKSQTALA